MTMKDQYVSLGILIVLVLLAHGAPQAHPSGSSQTLQKELAQAREKLRVSQAGEAEIEAELRQLKQSGNASGQKIRDYEIYLERINALVLENRRKVRRLESLQQKYGVGKKVAQSRRNDEDSAGIDPEIPEESTGDPVADLDRQLDQSLAAYDAALLKEMDLIKIQSAEKMKDLTDEAEAARQRLKDQGIDIDAQAGQEDDKTPEGQGPETDSQSGQGDPEPQPEPGENRTSGHSGSPDSGQAETGTVAQDNRSPADGVEGASKEEEGRYGRGEDDDIVARQLREAAQKETDPELRQRLWEEYEAYKKNQ